MAVRSISRSPQPPCTDVWVSGLLVGRLSADSLAPLGAGLSAMSVPDGPGFTASPEPPPGCLGSVASFATGAEDPRLFAMPGGPDGHPQIGLLLNVARRPESLPQPAAGPAAGGAAGGQGGLSTDCVAPSRLRTHVLGGVRGLGASPSPPGGGDAAVGPLTVLQWVGSPAYNRNWAPFALPGHRAPDGLAGGSRRTGEAEPQRRRGVLEAEATLDGQLVMDSLADDEPNASGSLALGAEPGLGSAPAAAEGEYSNRDETSQADPVDGGAGDAPALDFEEGLEPAPGAAAPAGAENRSSSASVREAGESGDPGEQGEVGLVAEGPAEPPPQADWLAAADVELGNPSADSPQPALAAGALMAVFSFNPHVVRGFSQAVARPCGRIRTLFEHPRRRFSPSLRTAPAPSRRRR